MYYLKFSFLFLSSFLFYSIGIYADTQDRSPEFEIKTLEQKIDYSYGYEEDKTNFVEGLIDEEGETKDFLVLVNMHTDMPLNTTNEYNPKKRTLKWGLPYENAYYNLFRTQDAHKNSALLREWTSGGFREKVSFVIIPPEKKIAFAIGYAKEQSGQKYGKEEGYGMQMRLKNLPEGTIVITTNLVIKDQKNKPKRSKSFSLKKLLDKGIEEYNQNNQGWDIPEEISDIENYLYLVNSIEDVLDFHIVDSNVDRN